MNIMADNRWRDLGIALTIVVLLQIISIAAIVAVQDNRPVYAHPKCAQVLEG